MDSIRIWRSPRSFFGKFLEKPEENKEETITSEKAYTDEELKDIAASGFNGIWVYGLLHHLVCSKEFPEFGLNSEMHLEAMRKLIKRAAEYGIKVYIYIQPPHAIPESDTAFWNNHRDVGGQAEERTRIDGDGLYKVRCLCTSTFKVKEYLKEAAASLARSLPALGGVIVITASEYPAHCYTRRGRTIGAFGEIIKKEIECPRCSRRAPEDVVSDLIHLLRDGIRSISNSIQIIIWNWSWTFYVNAPCREIIEKLPNDVIFMTDFERGGRKKILNRKNVLIDEYSLSYAGPSEQALKSCHAAQFRGLQCMVKLQIGTTHELATVPNLPLIGNLYDKAKAMKEHNISSFMGCWNFGNMISVNTAAFNYFLNREVLKDRKTELENFAGEFFPGCDSSLAATAWIILAEAMDNYPFSIPFLYASPINYALTYPLEPGPINDIPCGRSWLLDKVRGENLDASLGNYTIEEIVSGLTLLSRKWKDGAELFTMALNEATGVNKENELNSIWTACHIFQSVMNIYKVYSLRKNWTMEKLEFYLKIIRNELENLEAVLPIIEKDKRLGFHIEAFDYMFSPDSIRAKIMSLQEQLKANHGF